MVIALITFENQRGVIRRIANLIETRETDVQQIWQKIKQSYIENIATHHTHAYDNMCVDEPDLLNTFFIEAINGTVINCDCDNYTEHITAHIAYSYFSLHFNTTLGFYKTYIVNHNHDNNCMSRAASTVLTSKSSNITSIINSITIDNNARNTTPDYKTSDIVERDISSLRYLKQEAEHLARLCNTIIEHITDTTIH